MTSDSPLSIDGLRALARSGQSGVGTIGPLGQYLEPGLERQQQSARRGIL
jgi:hypothetical protein